MNHFAGNAIPKAKEGKERIADCGLQIADCGLRIVHTEWFLPSDG